MASLERDRIARFIWNALRYALGPIGGLLVPWLVIERHSVEVWGQIVTTMILVQLAAHVTQWGSKDHLLRQFARSPENALDRWRGSMVTRAVPGLIAALIITGSGWIENEVWAVCWLISLVLVNNMEPLVVWRKKFTGAAVADVVGLAAQVVLVLWDRPLSGEAIVRSFAVNQITRALVLWGILGFPFFGQAFTLFNARAYLLSALPFFLTGLSGLLASRIDLYTANGLLERADAGRYQVVTSVFLQFQALAALITTPMTRDLYRLQATSVSRFSSRLRTWALIGLLPMTAIAWALLTLLFRFELDWMVFAAGCALVWPVFAYVPLITPLYKHGHERTVMMANFVAAALSCALTWLLLPRLGITGGLVGAAAGQWLMFFWIKARTNHLHHALPTV